jgi:hypothetical protein
MSRYLHGNHKRVRAVAHTAIDLHEPLLLAAIVIVYDP